MTDHDKLRALASAATPGEWHHVQAFQTVPKTRTIHGTVPAQRVDYVSTWPGPGTPDGHRVVIPMEGRETTARSEDMAFIAAANPKTVLGLLDELTRLRADNSRLTAERDEALAKVERLKAAAAESHLPPSLRSDWKGPYGGRTKEEWDAIARESYDRAAHLPED